MKFRLAGVLVAVCGLLGLAGPRPRTMVSTSSSTDPRMDPKGTRVTWRTRTPTFRWMSRCQWQGDDLAPEMITPNAPGTAPRDRISPRTWGR
jgi:hypothetical protein